MKHSLSTKRTRVRREPRETVNMKEVIGLELSVENIITAKAVSKNRDFCVF